MKVVVVGAGLGGLAAAATSSAGATRSRSSNGRPQPGGRAGVVAGRATVLDNGPTVLTMPGLLGGHLRRCRGRHGRLRDHPPRRPDVPGRVRRRQRAAGLARPGVAWRDGDRGVRRAGRRRRLRALLRNGSTELYELEMPHFIDTNFDSRARPGPARWRPRCACVRMGGFRKPRPRGALLLPRRAPAADLLLPVDVRRPGARTRRWRSTRSSPTWTRSRGCSRPRAACTAWPAAWPARSRRPEPSSATARRWRRILRAGSGAVTGVELVERRRTGSAWPPMRWSATPTCPWPTARCSAGSTRPRAARRGTLLAELRAVGGGRAGRRHRRAARTTTSTSGPTGTAPSGP